MILHSYRQLLVPLHGGHTLERLQGQIVNVLADYTDVLADPDLILPLKWHFWETETRAAPDSPRARPLEPLVDQPGAWPLPDGPVGAIRIRTDAPPGQVRELFGRLRNVGATHQSDPGLHSTLWADGTTFGTRQQAHELIEAVGPAAGANRVNVVVVDQGFDARLFPTNFAGGFGVVGGQQPGEGRSSHAAAVARTVLKLVPGAKLYDAPLIPLAAPGARDTINSIPAFALDACCLWLEMAAAIGRSRGRAPSESWVLVNAWAVYDRATDRLAPHYMTDKAHILNTIVSATAELTHPDTVFAAGNCGQFAPDIRCGATDCGPGRSITGANSLDCVLTVGAVRTDGTWLGYSSQGPGQPSLGHDKPDLCAPTGFGEDVSPDLVLSGTSGAAAVAAGVVARLRTQFGQNTVPPGLMKDVLRKTARPMPETPTRLGRGIIRAAPAVKELLAR